MQNPFDFEPRIKRLEKAAKKVAEAMNEVNEVAETAKQVKAVTSETPEEARLRKLPNKTHPVWDKLTSGHRTYWEGQGYTKVSYMEQREKNEGTTVWIG